MAIIDRLVAVLGFEREPGSDNAEQEYNSSLDNMSRNVQRVATFAAAAATAVVGLSTVVGAMAVKVAGATDELGKFAAARGLSFEDLQEYIFAGEQFGNTSDEIVASIAGVQEKLAEYKRGQGDFQVLGQIGVSVAGADTFQFIERLADRFSQLDALRAQELGKKLGLGQNFIMMLQSGTAGIAELRQEARDLGIVLDGQAAVSAANFNDSMNRIRRVIGSVRDRVILQLVPAITQIADQIAEFVKQNRQLLQQGLTTFVEALFIALVGLSKALLYTVSLFGSLSEAVGGTRNAVILLGIAFLSMQLATSGVLLRLIASIKTVGIAVTLLNAKVLLVPALIAAAVTAVLLVLQDLYVFMRGGDSVIGRIADGFSRWRADLGAMKPLVDALLIPFDALVKAGEFIGTFAGKIATGEASAAVAAAVRPDRPALVDPAIRGFGPFAGVPTTNSRSDMSVSIDINGGNVDSRQLGQSIGRELYDLGSADGMTVITGVNQ